MTGPLSCRNQSIDLLCKSMDWFLYDNRLRHERVKWWDIQKINFEIGYLKNFDIKPLSLHIPCQLLPRHVKVFLRNLEKRSYHLVVAVSTLEPSSLD